MANVIVRDIGKIGKGDAFRVVPLGDIHLGAAACDEAQFRNTVSYIKTNKLHWIGMGDYADFINMRDPRFSVGGLAPWVGMAELIDLAKAQRDRFLDIIAPIAPYCLGLLMGNHETSILRHYERDIYSEIVTGVKERGGFKADYPLALGYSGWLRLRFHRTDTDKRQIKLYLHHGYTGGKLAGAKALDMQRALWSKNADLIVFGHCHDTQGQRAAVEDINDADEIIYRYRVGCFSGTYLKTAQQGTTTYSEVKGYLPLPIGGVEIYMHPFADVKVRVMI